MVWQMEKFKERKKYARESNKGKFILFDFEFDTNIVENEVLVCSASQMWGGYIQIKFLAD